MLIPWRVTVLSPPLSGRICWFSRKDFFGSLMQPAPAFPGVLVGGRRKVQQQKISGRMNQGDMDVSENSQDII